MIHVFPANAVHEWMHRRVRQSFCEIDEFIGVAKHLTPDCVEAIAIMPTWHRKVHASYVEVQVVLDELRRDWMIRVVSDESCLGVEPSIAPEETAKVSIRQAIIQECLRYM